ACHSELRRRFLATRNALGVIVALALSAAAAGVPAVGPPVARPLRATRALRLGVRPEQPIKSRVIAPPVATRGRIVKHAHQMEVYDDDIILGRFRIAIGGGGLGPKLREGDKITPVGHYHVVGRGWERWLHGKEAFLLLDYPNESDKERFRNLKARGRIP